MTLCSFKVCRRQQLKKKQKAEKNKFEKKNNFVTILLFFSAIKIRIELREGSLKRKIYALQGGITAITVMTKWSPLFAIEDEKTFYNAVTILVFSYGFEILGYSLGYSYRFYAFRLQFWFLVIDLQFLF